MAVAAQLHVTAGSSGYLQMQHAHRGRFQPPEHSHRIEHILPRSELLYPQYGSPPELGLFSLLFAVGFAFAWISAVKFPGFNDQPSLDKSSARLSAVKMLGFGDRNPTSSEQIETILRYCILTIVLTLIVYIRVVQMDLKNLHLPPPASPTVRIMMLSYVLIAKKLIHLSNIPFVR